MSNPKRGTSHASSDKIENRATPAQPDATEIDLRSPSQPLNGNGAKPARTNLQLPRSSLIGRAHELAALQRLLLQEEVSLLTITGTGGIGKTRLAMQVAFHLLDHFVDGVYFVSLAPLRSAELVSAAIAETLGVREASSAPLLETL